MKRGVVVAVLAILVVVSARPGFPQPSDDLKALRKDVDALTEGQKALRGDLEEIKNLLKARPAAAPAAAPNTPPPNAVINVDGAPFRGDKNAKVTIVEFTDYQ